MSSTVDEALEFQPAPELSNIVSARSPAYLMSMDIGTSGVRVGLFEESGAEIPDAQIHSGRRLGQFSAFGELEPDQILEQLVGAIDELLLNSLFESERIEQIAISCFWHSLMGVDEEGRPTTPLFTWADTRATEAAAALHSSFDEKLIHARTGCRFHPSYWPAKLRWLQTAERDKFDSTAHWVGMAEYVIQRMFGATLSSVSMASATGLLNQESCEWDWDFIGALDVRRESLPNLGGDNLELSLRQEFRQRWPALKDARLSVVIGDGAANNIGGGCTTGKNIALMVGTSGAMRVVDAGPPPPNLPSALWCYRVSRSRIVVGGALSDGGGLFRWLKDLMSLGTDPDLLEKELALLAPDSHGLTLLPFWSGERSTGWSGTARGGIFGLTQSTRPEEIVRAALEAIAYRFAAIADALDELTPHRATVVATGNALRSSTVWIQILADVLGRPLVTGGSPEASIRGAALLALEVVGKIASIENLSVEVDAVFEPDMSRHEIYRAGRVRHEDLYQRLISHELLT